MAGSRSLEGAVVVVVGANGGLGSPIADELRRRGATVVGTAREAGDADVALDIRDSTAGETLVRTVLERHGRLDGVVIASGIVAFGDLSDTDDVVGEELMLTNALGPLWLARRVLDALADRQGFLVAITGVVAQQPQPGMASYTASKAALSAGLDAIRREFRRRKVAVIEISPPHTETGLATRPLAGTAPTFPEGLAPVAVAARVVDAIVEGESTVLADSFR